jgi:NADP-dependent 3-hydroxy acid dehydrogenase YdfG
MNRTVLITGATSGIGKACAIKFAQEGYQVIICGRRKEKLEQLQQQLSSKYQTQVHILCFDIQNKDAIYDAVKYLDRENIRINILINNAGLALGRDNFAEADITDLEVMIQTNVIGLLWMSRAVMPYFDSTDAHIINIGSISGKQVYENGSVYCATKHAVDALSKGMRIDLLKKNIKVTAVHPGAVETEFSMIRFKGDANQAKQVYEGYKPLSGTDIAETVYYCATLPPHVCINDIIITCTQQADAFYINKSTF